MTDVENSKDIDNPQEGHSDSPTEYPTNLYQNFLKKVSRIRFQEAPPGIRVTIIIIQCLIAFGFFCILWFVDGVLWPAYWGALGVLLSGIPLTIWMSKKLAHPETARLALPARSRKGGTDTKMSLNRIAFIFVLGFILIGSASLLSILFLGMRLFGITLSYYLVVLWGFIFLGFSFYLLIPFIANFCVVPDLDSRFIPLKITISYDKIFFDRGRIIVIMFLSLVLCPLFLGWISASLAWTYIPNRIVLNPAAEQSIQGKSKTCLSSINEFKKSKSPWYINGEPIRVAIALSGGGYRAALTHAGLLAALNDQGIPVSVLTTVSGGSIVGSACALGISPRAFAKGLANKKPGLANDLLHIGGVFKLVLSEYVTYRNFYSGLKTPPFLFHTTDIYSGHFKKVFFGNKKLADLRKSPELIINATDVESQDASTAREIFYKNAFPEGFDNGKDLDQETFLADLVAASGAFPGPFQPKRLSWAERASNPKTPSNVKERLFTDGGVTENLGLEGLRHYLLREKKLSEKLKGRELKAPHLLIISDASFHGPPHNVSPELSVPELLARSQDVSYEYLHRQLYQTFTGRNDIHRWIEKVPIKNQINRVPYPQIHEELEGTEKIPSELLTVTIPTTAAELEPMLWKYKNCNYVTKLNQEETVTLSDIQWHVRKFATLKELDKEEVKQAFWLGYSFGTIYAPAIECARAQIAGQNCETSKLDWGVRCSSIKEVLS